MSELLKEYEQEISTGLFPTQNARQAPFWSDGRNIVFEDASMKAGLGQYGMFYPEVSEPITGIKSTNQGGVRTIYYGTPTKIKKWTEAGGVVDVTPMGGFSGTEADLWSFARWGNWIVASNGVDYLHVDKNDGAGFVPLLTPFDWAKVIYGTDTQLIAMNTSFGGEYIAWSDIDDIEDWNAVPSNFAGEKPQRNLASEIIGAAKLGQHLGIYTKNELILMQFIGAPYVFSILPLLDGFGIESKSGIAVVGNRHYGLGQRYIWVTDGNSVAPVDAPAVHQFIYGDSEFAIDLDYTHLAVGWHDQVQSSVTFYYPTKGSTTNNIGVTLNYANKTWTICNFGRTAVDDSGLFPFAISGDFQGNIYQQATVATPPATVSEGILDLTNVSSTIDTGFGDCGFGELGFGGGDEIAG